MPAEPHQKPFRFDGLQGNSLCPPQRTPPFSERCSSGCCGRVIGAPEMHRSPARRTGRLTEEHEQVRFCLRKPILRSWPSSGMEMTRWRACRRRRVGPASRTRGRGEWHRGRPVGSVGSSSSCSCWPCSSPGCSASSCCSPRTSRRWRASLAAPTPPEGAKASRRPRGNSACSPPARPFPNAICGSSVRRLP